MTGSLWLLSALLKELLGLLMLFLDALLGLLIDLFDGSVRKLVSFFDLSILGFHLFRNFLRDFTLFKALEFALLGLKLGLIELLQGLLLLGQLFPLRMQVLDLTGGCLL